MPKIHEQDPITPPLPTKVQKRSAIEPTPVVSKAAPQAKLDRIEADLESGLVGDAPASSVHAKRRADSVGVRVDAEKKIGGKRQKNLKTVVVMPLRERERVALDGVVSVLARGRDILGKFDEPASKTESSQ